MYRYAYMALAFALAPSAAQAAPYPTRFSVDITDTLNISGHVKFEQPDFNFSCNENNGNFCFNQGIISNGRISFSGGEFEIEEYGKVVFDSIDNAVLSSVSMTYNGDGDFADCAGPQSSTCEDFLLSFGVRDQLTGETGRFYYREYAGNISIMSVSMFGYSFDEPLSVRAKVAEPGAIGLLGLGLIGAAARRRFKRS